MRKGKRAGLVVPLLLLIAVCIVSVAGCGKKPVVPTMETDLTVDLSSDIGLYFIGEGSGDFVRYSDTMDSGYFDGDKPTVLFFHGWSPGEDEDAGNVNITFRTTQAGLAIGKDDRDYAAELKEQGYNVGAMYWAKHAQNLFALFEKIWVGYEAGEHSVACRFAKEYVDCFQGYDKEIRFVGHSYGAQSSVATAYLAYKMAEQKIVDAALPSRISLADPYIGDLAVTKSVLKKDIENLGESINGRLPAELMADVMAYLKERGVVIDVYCGWPMAYDQFASDDTTRREKILEKLYANSVWTILAGMQNVYGAGDIHNLTLDWVARSLFVEKTDGAAYYPTAGLATEKMRSLVGKQYRSTYAGLDLEKEGFAQL